MVGDGGARAWVGRSSSVGRSGNPLHHVTRIRVSAADEEVLDVVVVVVDVFLLTLFLGT